MKRHFAFHKEKFLALAPKQQHKKCAEFLHEIVQGNTALILHYDELAFWLSLAPCPHDTKSLSDRLFWHMQKADMSKNERLLMQVTHFDRADAAHFLPIDIYLEGLRSIHNIGSIIRTTEAFRLGRIYLSNEVNHAKLQKSAMGCHEWVSCETIATLDRLTRPLIILETIPASTSYYDFVFPDRFTLAVGNEEYGCSDALIQASDACIHIPLFGRKNSLNVSNAFAVVAAWIAKTRPYF